MRVVSKTDHGVKYMRWSQRLFKNKLRIKTTIKLATRTRVSEVWCWKAYPKTNPVRKAVRIKPGKKVNFGKSSIPSREEIALLPAVTSGENKRAVKPIIINAKDILVSNSWIDSKLPKISYMAIKAPSNGIRRTVSDDVIIIEAP